MARFNSGATPSNTPSWSKSTPTIYNVTCTDADTEYSQALPEGCKAFAISLQAGTDGEYLRFAFVTGKVATPTAPYYQMTATQEYPEYGLVLSGKTIYFASSEAAKVAQIMAWV